MEQTAKQYMQTTDTIVRNQAAWLSSRVHGSRVLCIGAPDASLLQFLQLTTDEIHFLCSKAEAQSALQTATQFNFSTVGRVYETESDFIASSKPDFSTVLVIGTAGKGISASNIDVLARIASEERHALFVIPLQADTSVQSAINTFRKQTQTLNRLARLTEISIQGGCLCLSGTLRRSPNRSPIEANTVARLLENALFRDGSLFSSFIRSSNEAWESHASHIESANALFEQVSNGEMIPEARNVDAVMGPRIRASLLLERLELHVEALIEENHALREALENQPKLTEENTTALSNELDRVRQIARTLRIDLVNTYANSPFRHQKIGAIKRRIKKLLGRAPYSPIQAEAKVQELLDTRGIDAAEDWIRYAIRHKFLDEIHLNRIAYDEIRRLEFARALPFGLAALQLEPENKKLEENIRLNAGRCGIQIPNTLPS